MFTRTYILDISRWQHPFDIARLAQASPQPALIVHRATIGSLYQDSFFTSFARSISQLSPAPDGALFGAYHVVRPDYAARDQVKNFLKTIASVKLSFPVILDCELSGNQNGKTVSLHLLEVIRLLEDALNYSPIIYSRSNWLQEYFTVGEAKAFFYWIAYYPSLTTPQGTYAELVEAWENYTRLPAMPPHIGVDRLIMHQITDRADGSYFGAASKQIDVSFWLHPSNPVRFLEAYYPAFRQPQAAIKMPPCMPALSRFCPYSLE